MKRFLLILVVGLIACGGDDGKIRVNMIGGSDELQTLAIQQIEVLHTIARRQYSGFSNTYTIQVVPTSALCESPISFLLPAQVVEPGTNYDGSQYDKNPAIGVVQLCAAGRYLEPSGIIQVTEPGIRTSSIVRHEGEHQILRQVDPLRYEKTKIHAVGFGHPILGKL